MVGVGESPVELGRSGVAREKEAAQHPAGSGSHQGQCGKLGDAGVRGARNSTLPSLLKGRGEGRTLEARRRASQESGEGQISGVWGSPALREP